MNKELVKSLIEKGYLISPDVLDVVNNDELSEVLIKISSKDKPVVLNKDLYEALTKGSNVMDLNWYEFEKSRVNHEKGKNEKIYGTFLDILNYSVDKTKREKLNAILKDVEKPEQKVELEAPQKMDSNVIVLKSYKDRVKKRDVNDFVLYFRHRYEALRKILQARQELQNATSISRILNKEGREAVSLIGLVYSKYKTKNGNLLLSLEDPTGRISVLINQKNPELWAIAQDICEDEVIGVNGISGNKIIFANQVVFPDIMNSEVKKSEDEVYAAFISDLQVGSEKCLIDDLKKFVSWLNGDVGDAAQKEVSKKVKYLFLVGDLIDGVGIYPKQYMDLAVKDVVQQYQICADLFTGLRKDIKIIASPGNHDSLRLAEPQPAFNEYAKPLADLPNITLVSNPALVNIHSSENFSGFNVLLYHGVSFHHYLDNVDSLRTAWKGEHVDLIQKFLLTKRHIAPTHGSSLYIPDDKEDPLVIDKVPDLFVSGHMHKASVGTYNGVINICCGCWQSKTAMQDKYDIEPDKGRVMLFNLKTRQVKMLKFSN